MDSNLKPLSASFLYITSVKQLRCLIYQISTNCANEKGRSFADRAFDIEQYLIDDEKIRMSDWHHNVAFMYRRAYQTGVAFFGERNRPAGSRYESLLFSFSGRFTRPKMVWIPRDPGMLLGNDWISLPEGGFILTFQPELVSLSPDCTLGGTEDAYHRLNLVYQSGAIYDGRL